MNRANPTPYTNAVHVTETPAANLARSNTNSSEALTLFFQRPLREVIGLFLQSSKATRKHKTNGPTVITHIGDITLGDIRGTVIKRYVAHMLTQKTSVNRPFTAATIAVHLSIMRIAYKWYAEEMDLDAPSPAISTKHLPAGWDINRERRLEPQEERAIMREMRRPERKKGYHWRLLLKLALETAARLQELVLAEWKEFDLDRRVGRFPAVTPKRSTVAACP
jgi:integrase